ncbi:MAG: hypothetical protein DWQ04_31355 [Chloroflexi bacterium]|nr:MAG: hypothetical protein DWQ04_31355 [Chloroflexota bacterium]
MMVACESESTVGPSTNSQTLPTQEPVSTTIGLQSTATLSKSTVTPEPTESEATSQFSQQSILIPVTPSSPANAYSLKKWAQEERLAAIAEAKILINEDIEEQGPSDSAYYFQELIRYLILMEWELLLQYSNMLADKELAWDLAYRESVNTIAHYKVDRFISLLEEELNSGEISLDSITDDLFLRDFSVASILEGDDLFGKSKPGTFLQIESAIPTYSDDTIALVAISGSSVGEYQVIPLQPFWDWNHKSSLTISSDDHNENNTTEIIVIDDFWGSGSPGGCGSHLAIYEWREVDSGGHFENIAANVAEIVMSTAYGECVQPWELDYIDNEGVLAIKSFRRHFVSAYSYGDCPDYEEWNLYKWDGQAYTWADSGVNLIEGSPKCMMDWANLAGGLNDEAVSLVENALLDWSPEMETVWGPASEDYYRFKLGTWYALRGEQELAIKTLEAVRDYPVKTDFEKASELADLYLLYYEEQGVDAACSAVWDYIHEIAPHPECCGYDREGILSIWGFANPRWGSVIWDICEWEPENTNVDFPDERDWTSEIQDETILQLEQTLYESADPVTARMILLDLLGNYLYGSGSGELRAYLMYLLGLTYELTDDEAIAIDLYWHLWNEHPDSVYALLIRQKLELVE